MNLEDLTGVLEYVKKITKEAGRIILDVYKKDFQVDYKDDLTPVTEADRKSNDFIVSSLKNRYPECAVLAEESENDPERLKNDWCFIVDPLDGTKEFIQKNGEFTVNIALSYKGKPVLGVIGIPVTGELYYAVKGKGAFYEKDGHAEQIHVSTRTDDIRLVMSRSHKSQRLLELVEKNGIKNIRNVGSAIKGCLVAKGEAEVYYRFGVTMEWDTAAMQCIVEEAGGIFRQLDDTEMTYNRENSRNEKGFYAINHPANKLMF
ncbi:3'(2'),5'-bisphosphate nucleotidase CysQ [Thermoclostridium stercorarium subsp. leptospartum DSM 9219]|uniref:3'(2'),5'-bisphosphate nucleotidase CysQ n=1 Tax=Thermoclostridium stercorarium subsp. leptospartum DSM 9219 TaxID=1346611 RepID=A0A1B1YHJ4_THEST|nr:3'(2'),5'-bisphosphate nucleotidase CysQ [Thermoclostridium stercorarium]ANX00237.1 3'(2'),5'-bisphosphate nucleotidase CysQ [Thermoclostridium stercorarium subsp. leptospartum DSM 9219]